MYGIVFSIFCVVCHKISSIFKQSIYGVHVADRGTEELKILAVVLVDSFK